MEPIGPPVLLLAADAVDGFAGLPGWTVHRGFDLGDAPWDVSQAHVVCVGVVDDDATGAALAAVTRGAGLAIAVEARGAVRHRFLEDLHKVSRPVPYEPESDPAISHLGPVQRELLDALAQGATVTAAASAAHVSRRTANRLLADARALLDVDSTAAAVARWVSAGPDAAS